MIKHGNNKSQWLGNGHEAGTRRTHSDLRNYRNNARVSAAAIVIRIKLCTPPSIKSSLSAWLALRAALSDAKNAFNVSSRINRDYFAFPRDAR